MPNCLYARDKTGSRRWARLDAISINTIIRCKLGAGMSGCLDIPGYETSNTIAMLSYVYRDNGNCTVCSRGSVGANETCQIPGMWFISNTLPSGRNSGRDIPDKLD